MRRVVGLVVTLGVALLLGATVAGAGTRVFSANLEGAHEAPTPVVSANRATVTLTVDPRTRAFQLVVLVSGPLLAGDIVGFHIHREVAGVAGPIIVDMGTGGFATVPGGLRKVFSGTIPAGDLDDLFAEGLYVNLHSSAFTGGEIRGQLVEGALGAPKVLTADLTGGQETPAVPTAARGFASLIWTPAAQAVSIRAFVSGIAKADVVGFHVHRAGPGVPGPIIVPFDHTQLQDTAGGLLFSGTGFPITDAADVEKFLGGQTYVNVHSTAYPGGEIRGQVLLGTPSFLVAGAGVGGGPHVRVFDVRTGAERFSFFPYDPGYRGGVRVASCDLDDDGMPDIVTATGVGGAPHIRVFDGLSGQPLPDVGALASFFAFDPGFVGGTTIACADIDGDGRNDIVVAAGQGGAPNVATFSGYADGTVVQVPGPFGNFFPFDPAFLGGSFVGTSP